MYKAGAMPGPCGSNGGGLQLLGDVGGGLAAVHHQGEEVEDEGRRGECSDVCVVVGRGDLDDVGAHDVDAVQSAEQGQQFAGVEPAHFRGAGARRVGRVEDIDVDGDIDRGVAQPLLDALDRGRNPDDVQVRAADDLEAELVVAKEIVAVIDRAADADVHRLVLDQKAFLEGPAEDGSVRDRLVEIGVPGIKVCVEVEEGHGTVDLIQGPQHRERDGVVAADGDQPLAGAGVAKEREGLFRDLADCAGDVVGGTGDVDG